MTNDLIKMPRQLFGPDWGSLTVRFLVLAAACFMSSLAMATDYYFSDCATGCVDDTTGATCTLGNNSTTNPWCLDPDDTGSLLDIWFAYLTDGSAPEVSAGDTMHLCCGGNAGCEAAGQSCTVNLDPSIITTNSLEYIFAPQVTGTSGNRITLQPFCTGGSCDTVTISGDADDDLVWTDTVDNYGFVSHRFSGAVNMKYWTLDGNPLIATPGVGDAKYLILEEFGGRMFNFDGCATADCGIGNWEFKSMEIREVGRITDPENRDSMWSAGTPPDFFDGDCDPGQVAGVPFKINYVSGDILMQGNLIHSICGFGTRNNNNCETHTITLDGNEMYNLGAGTNEQNASCSGSTGTYIYSNNYLHDTNSGIFVEKNMRNVTVEDNIIACLGEFRLTDNQWCGQALRIGDEGLSDDMDDIIVRRNKIFGTGESGGLGWFNGGLLIQGGNTGPTVLTVTVENNMIWHIFGTGGGGIEATGTRGALNITVADDPVTVQNNTVYDSAACLSSKGAAHVFKNNLAVNCSDWELAIHSDATGGTYEYGNYHDTASDIICDNYNGSTCGTTYSCANVTNFDANSKCASTTFIQCDSGTWCDTTNADETTWDLHLVAADTNNKDAGTTGATDDIDQDSRPQGEGTDIGADELLAAATARAVVTGKASVTGKAKVQ